MLAHLNQLISWYRHSTTGIQSVGLPSDAIYQDNTKTLGSQAIALAFQSAKAEAALIAAQQKNGAAQSAFRGDHTATESRAASGQDFNPDRSIAIPDRRSELPNCKNPGPPQGESYLSARRRSEPTRTSEGPPRRRSKDGRFRRNQWRDLRWPRGQHQPARPLHSRRSCLKGGYTKDGEHNYARGDVQPSPLWPTPAA